MIRLILTGGGTGGHIYPNIAIAEEVYKKEGSRGGKGSKSLKQTEILYIGSRTGMEKAIVGKFGLPYKGIFCGKLRRYFSFYTIRDLFLIPLGILQSLIIINRFKPDYIFSKGGYVTIPVIIAGWLRKIKIIIHDSDSIPGLSTRIAARFANKICLAYEEAKTFLPAQKTIVTGIPLRSSILRGSREKALEICHLIPGKSPIVLVFGGSLGANFINNLVWQSLDKLSGRMFIIHLTGAGKLPAKAKNKASYLSFESVGDNICHLYALADLIISRAGANAIAEIETLGKPSLLIPLSKKASHGDQISNAAILEKKGGCLVLPEEEATPEKFMENILSLLKDSQKFYQIGKKAKTDLHFKASERIVDLFV